MFNFGSLNFLVIDAQNRSFESKSLGNGAEIVAPSIGMYAVTLNLLGRQKKAEKYATEVVNNSCLFATKNM